MILQDTMFCLSKQVFWITTGIRKLPFCDYRRSSFHSVPWRVSSVVRQGVETDCFRPRLGQLPADRVSHVQSGAALLLDNDSFHFTDCVARLAVNLPE